MVAFGVLSLIIWNLRRFVGLVGDVMFGLGLFDCLCCFCCLFVLCFGLIYFGFILSCRIYLYGIFEIYWCLIFVIVLFELWSGCFVE